MVFKKRSVGIKISDHTAEVIGLQRRGRRISLFTSGSATLPPGVVEHGRVVDPAALRGVIEALLSGATPVSVKTDNALSFALPDVQVFFHIFSVTDMSPAEVDTWIHSAILKTIPISEDDLLYSHTSIERAKGAHDVIVVATRRSVVKEWLQFFTELGYEIPLFDLEPLAMYRALFEHPVAQSICLVDIGSRTTNIAFFEKEGLRYTQVSHVAGNMFTDALAPFSQTPEEDKKTAGLNQTNAAAASAIRVVAQSLATTIDKSVSFYEKSRGSTIERIIICGGSSATIGLVEFLGQALGRPVERAGGTMNDSSLMAAMGAYGIAMRGIDPFWKKRDIGIHVEGLYKKSLARVISEQGEQPEDAIPLPPATIKRHHIIEGVLVTIIVLMTMVGFWWAFQVRAERRKELEKERQQIQMLLQKEQAAAAQAVVVPETTSSTEVGIDEAAASTTPL